MSKQALAYDQYLAGMPPERSREVKKVWDVVRENIAAGYSEEIGPKFLTFKAGEEWYVALANQKNYISLYLMPVYVCPELKARLDASGKKLKCGKSCINFKSADDLPLEVIAEIVSANDAKTYKERIQQIRSEYRKQKKSRRE